MRVTILAKLAKHKAILSLVFAFVFGVAVAPSLALAQPSPNCDTNNDPFCIEPVGDQFDGVLGNRGLIETITAIIRVGLSLLGLVAVVIILAGGFKWMTAGGSPDKVDEARKLIISGIVGIAIILSAFALAQFVLDSLLEATSSGSGGGDFDN